MKNIAEIILLKIIYLGKPLRKNIKMTKKDKTDEITHNIEDVECWLWYGSIWKPPYINVQCQWGSIKREYDKKYRNKS